MPTSALQFNTIKKPPPKQGPWIFPLLALTASARLEGLVADFKNTGLIGGAAIGQDAGLVLKSLTAVVLNSSVLKLVAHGIEGGRTALDNERESAPGVRHGTPSPD